MTSLKLPLNNGAKVAGQAGSGGNNITATSKAGSGLLIPARSVAQLIDKQLVAASFSAAAETYDAFAEIQQEAGIRLLDKVSRGSHQLIIADIGCGTGWLTEQIRYRFPQASLVGVDLAAGMVSYALKKRPGCADAWWVGDMEALPIGTGSCDLLVSNLAMQWLASPVQWFKEAYRLLRPGSQLLCSTLLPGTLAELEQSWRYADGSQLARQAHTHVNSFASLECLRESAQAAGLTFTSLSYRDVRYYPAVRDLMTELKSIGAHNISYNRPHHITGKNRIRRMLEGYEKFHSASGYPATYEVALLRLSKP